MQAFDFRRDSIDLMNSSTGSATEAHVCEEGNERSYVATVLTFFVANIGCASAINETLKKPYLVQGSAAVGLRHVDELGLILH